MTVLAVLVGLFLAGALFIGVILAAIWFVVRAVFWLVLLPFRLLFFLVGLPFVLLGGILAMAAAVVGGLLFVAGAVAAAALLVPLFPLSLVVFLVWLLFRRSQKPAATA